MIPLIDGDILLHEIGWSGEFKDKETGDIVLLDWDHVEGLLTKKIEYICEDVEATMPPIIFVTNSQWLTDMVNKAQKYGSGEKCVYIPNIRYDIAQTKPYKGTRKNPKPFHFYNILDHLFANYHVIISRDGLEADDMMCLYQTSHQDTIICSRDKDLRICPGWHYSWECGKQRSVGPHYTDRLGSIDLVDKSGTKTIVGYGLKFFFTQLITGDAADNIPGLPKQGAVRAFNLIDPCTTEEEAFRAVQSLYKEIMGSEAKNFYEEQMQLLWMRQTDEPRYKLRK